ncbi:MAG: ABC-ATPase domain-containing protein, partial [Gemmatimonadota bacterium]
MATLDDLARRLHAIDGRGYKAYKDVRGAYDADDDGFRLLVDHVQGDPYAQPSRLRAMLPPAFADLPDWALRDPVRRRATADFLNRAFADALA